MSELTSPGAKLAASICELIDTSAVATLSDCRDKITLKQFTTIQDFLLDRLGCPECRSHCETEESFPLVRAKFAGGRTELRCLMCLLHCDVCDLNYHQSDLRAVRLHADCRKDGDSDDLQDDEDELESPEKLKQNKRAKHV